MLQVLVAVVRSHATEKDDRVETDTEASALCVGSRGDDTGEGSLGFRVTSLEKKQTCQQTCCDCNNHKQGSLSYLALQGSDLEGLECLAGLVAVANILERLGGILAGNVEKNLLTAAIRSNWLAP